MKKNITKPLTSCVRCFGARAYLRTRVGLIALAALAYMVTASAAVIGWHPAINAQIGDAINFNDPTKRADFATTQSDITLSDTGSFVISGVFTQSKHDLSKALSVSASVDVKSTFYSVGAEVDFVQNQSFSANTVNFAIKYWKDFPDETGTSLSILTSVRDRISARVNDPDEQRLRWIRENLGTHYVRGYKKAAYAVVSYRLTTQESTFDQNFRAKMKATFGSGFNSGNLELELNKAFSRSQSKTFLEYEFLGSDPDVPPDFPITGKIDSLTGFIEFGETVEAYARELTSENARITGYLVEDIRSFPGFPEGSGLEGQLAAEANYDEFLKNFRQLQLMREVLIDWFLNPGGLSWLTPSKQAELALLSRQIESLRTSMKDTALQHFTEGAPLTIEEPLFETFEIFSKIPTPRIHVVTDPKIGDGGNRVMFGYIDCGPRDSVTEVPFQSISTKNPNGMQTVYYSDEEWFVRLRQVLFPGNAWNWVIGGGIRQNIVWDRLFEEAENGPRRLGFFVTTSRLDRDSISFFLQNAAGQIIDSVPGNVKSVN